MGTDTEAVIISKPFYKCLPGVNTEKPSSCYVFMCSSFIKYTDPYVFIPLFLDAVWSLWFPKKNSWNS